MIVELDSLVTITLAEDRGGRETEMKESSAVRNVGGAEEEQLLVYSYYRCSYIDGKGEPCQAYAMCCAEQTECGDKCHSLPFRTRESSTCPFILDREYCSNSRYAVVFLTRGRELSRCVEYIQ